jgi:hypothetical protein
MPYYRKKPVIIEARKLTENNVNEILKWCSHSSIKIILNNI